MVLFEDLADVIGVIIAFTGILLSHLLNAVYIDGIASLLIGLLLTTVAVLLVRESRSLLMGEPVASAGLVTVKQLLESQASVQSVHDLQSMYLGPEEVILLLRIGFPKDISANQTAASIRQLREMLQLHYPNFRHVFIEPV